MHAMSSEEPIKDNRGGELSTCDFSAKKLHGNSKLHTQIRNGMNKFSIIRMNRKKVFVDYSGDEIKEIHIPWEEETARSKVFATVLEKMKNDMSH